MLALSALAQLACAPAQSVPQIDVVARVALVPERAVAGWPVLVRYAFDTGPNFVPAGHAWRAFVHFVAEDGASPADDDHVPVPSPASWAAGRHYEYERVVFTPRQFPGRLDVVVGLFDPASGARVRFRSQHVGRGEHRLATLQTSSAGEQSGTPLYGEGISGPSGDLRQPFLSRRWLADRGVLSFRNPRADAVLFLRVRAEGPATGEPRVVTVSVSAGSARAARRVGSHESTTLAFQIVAKELGDGDWSDLELRASRDHGEVSDAQAPLLSIDNAVLVPLSSVDPRLLAATSASATAAAGGHDFGGAGRSK